MLDIQLYLDMRD